MNNNETIEKLKHMRLGAMAELHDQHVKSNQFNDITPDEYLALLADHEWEYRQNKKVDRLIQQSQFRQKATVEEVNYAESRNLDKNMFHRLSTLDFMGKNENIILIGASGVGKSYLAQALGHQACITGKKVYYTNTSRLLAKLKLSKVDGTYIKELRKLSKIDLLILDDFGLQAFDNHAREALMDIIDDRHKQSYRILSNTRFGMV